MSLQAQAFTGFTSAMFEAFAAKIKQDIGIDIQGNSGTVQHGSFEFTYDYNPDTQILHIQCLKKPLFIPSSTIINGIAEEVAALKSVGTIQISMGMPSLNKSKTN